jgi:hypothetical protein
MYNISHADLSLFLTAMDIYWPDLRTFVVGVISATTNPISVSLMW